MSITQGLHRYQSDLYAAWKGEVDDDRLFYSSFDGRTWQNQTTIPGNSSIGPSLATFGNKLYAAWKGERSDHRLFYAGFDGKTWDNQDTIPGNSSVGPALAAFNGALYAAWKGEQYDQRLFYAPFDGASWSAQQQIPGVASSVGPSLAAFGNKLYAAWKGMDCDQCLWYASFDGANWSAQQQIPGVASSIGPSLAVFENRLCAAWKGSDRDQRLWYAFFDGANWSAQQQIPGVGSSLGPALAVFRDKLYAIWKGESDQRIWYASFDGAKWSGQATLPGNTGQDPIRIIFVPDVHLNYWGPGQPNVWIKQCDWIKQNQGTYNLQSVLCTGDFLWTGNPGDGDPWNPSMNQNPPQYPDCPSSGGLSTIDALNIPYLAGIGNHDYTRDDPTSADISSRDNAVYLAAVHTADQSAKPWFVEFFKEPALPANTPAQPNPNIAVQFDVGARQIMVITLEHCPRPSVLTWAGEIINNNPTREVTILTHLYMTMSGRLIDQLGGDCFDCAPASYFPAAAGMTPASPDYQNGYASSGLDINLWAKTFSNVRLVLCGHVIPYGACPDASTPCQPDPKTSQTPYAVSWNWNYRSDTANDGHKLLGIYANYQCYMTPSQTVAGSDFIGQVVLLLELGDTQMSIRAFDTSAGAELPVPDLFPAPPVPNQYAYPETDTTPQTLPQNPPLSQVQDRPPIPALEYNYPPSNLPCSLPW